MELEGIVTNVTAFGAFVRLEEGVEGLVYVSEMAAERVEKPSDVVKEGDTVKAIVMRVDPAEQKISLSIRALTDKEQRESLKRIAKQQAQSQTTTLGDLLKEKLAERADGDAETQGED